MKFVHPENGGEYLNLSGKPVKSNTSSSPSKNGVIDVERAKRDQASNAVLKFVMLLVFLGGVFLVFILPSLINVGAIRLW